MDGVYERIREAARLLGEFESRDSLPALHAAVEILRDAVSSTAEGDPMRPTAMASLSAALSSRARRLGGGSDSTESVEAAREVVARTPVGHADRGRRLSNLTDALLTRFGLGGDVTDLDEAVEAGRRAVGETPADDAMLARRLINLAAALSERFEATHVDADLAAAVEVATAASDADRADAHDHAMALSALGDVRLTRFNRHDDPADLAAAVDAFRAAVAAAPPDHPDRFGFLCNLGLAQWQCFEDTGLLQPLNDAIASLRSAMAGIAPNHPYHVLCVENLGNALHSRFERLGHLDDLDDAIDMLALAATEIPAGHPERPVLLSNLAVARQSRFERLNDIRDADRALDDLEEAVGSTRAHPHHATYLANIGNALRVRFQAAGKVNDLDRAVDSLRAALAATPLDHPEYATFLGSLSSALTTRFRRHGEVADVDAAVEAVRRAVAVIRPTHPDFAAHHDSLSVALHDRFQRTRDARDVDAAIVAARTAVDATPADDPRRAAYLANLGIALRSRSDDNGPPADLDAAIRAAEAALAATPVDHPHRPGRLSNLGAALRARYAESGHRADLDVAVEMLREAAATIPADHPDRAGMLHNLGRALHALFILTGATEHADAAVACDKEASGLDTAPPGARLTAARTWGRLARDIGDVRSAAEGYAAAVALLPFAAWHGLARETREVHLVDSAGLASEAVVALVEAGDLPRAVELLEQARSVLWTQALNLRSDLTRLAEQAPELAADLDRVRDELGRSAIPIGVGTGPGGLGLGDAVSAQTEQIRTLERRRLLAARWDELVGEIRGIKDFRDFLAPTPFARLRQAAAQGPVVVLVAGEQRGYALVVTATGTPGIDVVELPTLTHEEAVARANLLLTATSAGVVRQRRGVKASIEQASSTRDMGPSTIAGPRVPSTVLEWLWTSVAQPVLDHLTRAGDHHGEQLPRVWWSPVGPLAMLPIHAAGRHTADGPAADRVSARLVSSYTPTLAALLRARSGTACTVRQLAVGMSRTPRAAQLPAVTRELAVLSARFPPPTHGMHLLNRRATRAAVLRALATHPWVHFACHGVQDATQPSSSAFLLWDGRLTLDELAALRLRGADLAFLSACQTATGNPLLIDEAIHLAAAMQLLGYRHVIGTLWTIGDADAPEVADAVYGRLAADGRDLTHTAEALHGAVEKLRERHPAQPLRWAQYVHFGP